MRVEEEEAKRAEAARKAEEEEALASERAGLFTPLASEDAWPLMPGGGTCLLDGEALLCPWGVVFGAVVGTAVIGCVLSPSCYDGCRRYLAAELGGFYLCALGSHDHHRAPRCIPPPVCPLSIIRPLHACMHMNTGLLTWGYLTASSK